MILAGLWVALQAGMVKYASQSLSIEAIFFGRSVVAFALASLYLIPSFKKVFKEKSVGVKSRRYLILRALCGALAALFFYYSIQAISVSVATMLYLTFPVFVPLVNKLWLKIPMTPRMGWGLAIAFTGIVFVLHPTQFHFNGFLIVGLIAGIMGAIGSVINRLLHRFESQQKILFSYFLISLIIASVCFAMKSLFSSLTFHPQSLWLLLIIGVTGFAFQYCFSLALRYAPARLMTPCTYFSLIFTVMIDRIFWGRNPSWEDIVGIIAIVIGVLCIAFSESSAAPSPPPQIS